MTTQTIIQQDTAEYQRNVSDFVSREVFYCVSQLIGELSQNESYIEEILEFSACPDYEKCAVEAGWTLYPCDDGTVDTINPEGEIHHQNLDRNEAWRVICDEENLDVWDYSTEAYEFWIVSDWLASRLEEKGHPVTHDFLGLTIWGRPTSGQAISMDGVICEIYNDLHS